MKYCPGSTRISLSGIILLKALTVIPTVYAAEQPQVAELEIAGGVIAALKNDTLTVEMLSAYFEKNSELLRNNIQQGLGRYKTDTVGETVTMNFEKYIQNKDRIISNWDKFASAKDRVSEKIAATFGEDIPAVVLVPCVGLMANGGWADNIDGTHYIFVALEIIPPQIDIGALLVHEITHAISEVGWDILLDGLYNEGYATYVSYELSPGMPFSVYFMMSPDMLANCYTWMNDNRETMAADSGKPLAVMNDMHKFYLTTSFTDYPNLGYVVGFEYIKHLRKTHTLEELRTFAMDVDANRAAFTEFLKNAEFGAETVVAPGN